MSTNPYERKRPVGRLKQLTDVAIGEVERRYIREVLERYDGYAVLAAKELGLSVRALRYKAARYGIPVGRRRDRSKV